MESESTMKKMIVKGFLTGLGAGIIAMVTSYILNPVDSMIDLISVGISVGLFTFLTSVLGDKKQNIT